MVVVVLVVEKNSGARRRGTANLCSHKSPDGVHAAVVVVLVTHTLAVVPVDVVVVVRSGSSSSLL